MKWLHTSYLFTLSFTLCRTASAFGFQNQDADRSIKLEQIPCAVSGHEITCSSVDYPGADNTQAWGINSRGEIVGTYVSGGVMHGFLLNRYGFSSIDYPGAASTYANGINIWGDIVGGYTIGGVTHGFLLSNGTYTTVDYPGGASSEVLGINAKGEIAGDYSTSSSTPCCAAGTTGILLKDGSFNLVQYPGATLTYADGINRQGDIVGSYSDTRGRAYLLNNSNYTSLDDPTATTTFMNALAINDRGEIVGRYADASGRYGYLLSDGQYDKIEVSNATFTGATSINNRGDIVGRYAGSNNVFHGFLLRKHPEYQITDLGTLGGTFSNAYGLNNHAHVGGGSTLPDGSLHAFLWTRNTGMRDLGTLPGGVNSSAGRPNDKDLIALISDTSTPDPYNENFCGFGTPLICVGGVWKNGVITPLPTLKGGNNAQTTNINERGEIVGYAENTTKDSSCAIATRGQVFDFEAVLWDRKGRIHELRPLPGDTVGFALANNNRGQTVGSSGTCANTPLVPLAIGPHAVLWESDRSPVSIEGLGGAVNNTGTSLNDREEVLGVSSLPGDTTVHTFLWTREKGTTDLGTVLGDASSIPAAMHALNNEGQAVGASCPSSDAISDVVHGLCRAYLWERSEMLDLNALVRADSNPGQLYLFLAFGINDDEEITGWGMTSTGDIHAFVAAPIHRHPGDADSAAAPSVDRPSAVLSGSRNRLRVSH
jgi:probable HAF family extracellular repeat protein